MRIRHKGVFHISFASTLRMIFNSNIHKMIHMIHTFGIIKEWPILSFGILCTLEYRSIQVFILSNNQKQLSSPSYCASELTNLLPLLRWCNSPFFITYDLIVCLRKLALSPFPRIENGYSFMVKNVEMSSKSTRRYTPWFYWIVKNKYK